MRPFTGKIPSAISLMLSFLISTDAAIAELYPFREWDFPQRELLIKTLSVLHLCHLRFECPLHPACSVDLNYAPLVLQLVCPSGTPSLFVYTINQLGLPSSPNPASMARRTPPPFALNSAALRTMLKGH